MQIRRILIVDYDSTAYREDSQRADKLSKEILEFTNENHFDAFYCCTHRCTIAPHPFYPDGNGGYEEPTAEIKTETITANFANATGLKCLAVSTLDDVLYVEAGAAYKLTQEADLETNDSIDALRLKTEKKCKNHQLIQIAKHAATFFGEKTQLHFVDDSRELIDKTAAIQEHPEWPKNTTLTSYWFTSKKRVMKRTFRGRDMLKSRETFSQIHLKTAQTSLQN